MSRLWLNCVCVCGERDLGWGDSQSAWFLPRCVDILHLQEAVHPSPKVRKYKQQLVQKVNNLLSHCFLRSHYLSYFFLSPQSHCVQTITNSSVSTIISLSKRSIWLLFVSLTLSHPWGNDYPGYGEILPSTVVYSDKWGKMEIFA